MLTWLNRNAPAVQAIASIASVCVTLMLAFVTYRYVQLTQSLAEAAHEQLRLQRHSAASEAAQLLTLVDLLSGSVAKCPVNERDGEKIRSIPLWKQSELTRLATLAASVLGPDTRIHNVIQKLNWIRARLEEVHATTPDAGYDWEKFPFAEWCRELGDTRSLLTQLRDDVEARSPVEPAASA
jgi:hypothetical protein